MSPTPNIQHVLSSLSHLWCVCVGGWGEAMSWTGHPVSLLGAVLPRPYLSLTVRQRAAGDTWWLGLGVGPGPIGANACLPKSFVPSVTS